VPSRGTIEPCLLQIMRSERLLPEEGALAGLDSLYCLFFFPAVFAFATPAFVRAAIGLGLGRGEPPLAGPVRWAWAAGLGLGLAVGGYRYLFLMLRVRRHQESLEKGEFGVAIGIFVFCLLVAILLSVMGFPEDMGGGL